MSFVNWVIDSLASEDVIDLYFILSDLIDISISEAESVDTACFDALSVRTANESADTQAAREIPIGKQVF